MRTERARILSLFRQLQRQPELKFPAPRKKLEVSTRHGVYVIRNPDGRVAHVGRTLRAQDGLYQRLYDHIRGRSSFVEKMLGGHGERLREGYSFQFLEVLAPRERALLEALAIAWLCPQHIGLGEGHEPTDGGS